MVEKGSARVSVPPETAIARGWFREVATHPLSGSLKRLAPSYAVVKACVQDRVALQPRIAKATSRVPVTKLARGSQVPLVHTCAVGPGFAKGSAPHWLPVVTAMVQRLVMLRGNGS